MVGVLTYRCYLGILASVAAHLSSPRGQGALNGRGNVGNLTLILVLY